MALRRLVARVGVVSLLAALWLCVASSSEPAVGDPFFWQYPALWWFNGLVPQNYHTEPRLSLGQAPADTTAVWTITSGSDKAGIVDGTQLKSTVTLTGMGANIIMVRSKARSTALEDVTVHLTLNGHDEGSTTHTVRSPDYLLPGQTFHWNYGNGYQSNVHYSVWDQFDDLLPGAVPMNENWTSAPVSDYTGEQWGWGPATGGTVDPADWYDRIIRANMTSPTCQNPQSPLGSTRIDHRGQRWYVGSVTIGKGKPVGDDTLQIYRDDGMHE